MYISYVYVHMLILNEMSDSNDTGVGSRPNPDAVGLVQDFAVMVDMETVDRWLLDKDLWKLLNLDTFSW